MILSSYTTAANCTPWTKSAVYHCLVSRVASEFCFTSNSAEHSRLDIRVTINHRDRHSGRARSTELPPTLHEVNSRKRRDRTQTAAKALMRDINLDGSTQKSTVQSQCVFQLPGVCAFQRNPMISESALARSPRGTSKDVPMPRNRPTNQHTIGPAQCLDSVY